MINEKVVRDLYKQAIASLRLLFSTSVDNAETTKHFQLLLVKGEVL